MTQIALESMESAGLYVAGTDVAMQAARSGLDLVAQHGQKVASISRHIADGTREQASTQATKLPTRSKASLAGLNRLRRPFPRSQKKLW